uniref:Uncharacterized protein n=1 Tax=Meloidogyne incognita TaxID=6306 RepID=A0A914NJI3_MELIC
MLLLSFQQFLEHFCVHCSLTKIQFFYHYTNTNHYNFTNLFGFQHYNCPHSFSFLNCTQLTLTSTQLTLTNLLTRPGSFLLDRATVMTPLTKRSEQNVYRTTKYRAGEGLTPIHNIFSSN